MKYDKIATSAIAAVLMLTLSAASAENLAAAGVVDLTQLAKVASSFAVGTSYDGDR